MHLSHHDCDLLSAELCPAPRVAELRAHAAACAACAAKLHAAEAERAAFLVSNPPAARVAALLAAAPPKRTPWWIFGSGLGVVAAAAVLMLVMTRAPVPETRWKGEALTCRLLRGSDTIAVLTPSQPHPALAGDRVACTIAPRNGRHVEVWGVSGNEAPELLLSADLDVAAALPREFAVGGHGEMRLYVVRSGAPIPSLGTAVAQGRFPENAEASWFALVLP